MILITSILFKNNDLKHRARRKFNAAYKYKLTILYYVCTEKIFYVNLIIAANLNEDDCL